MLLVILPHTVFLDHGKYSFLAHEIIRCYGAVTIGLGYMAYKIRSIKDGRIRRLLAETYFVVYGVTTLCLWKAWISNPASHTLWAVSLLGLSTFTTFLWILPILESQSKLSSCLVAVKGACSLRMLWRVYFWFPTNTIVGGWENLVVVEYGMVKNGRKK